MRRGWVAAGLVAAAVALLAALAWRGSRRGGPEDAARLATQFYQAVRGPSEAFAAIWTADASAKANERWRRLRPALPDSISSISTCRIVAEDEGWVVEVQPHADAPPGSPCHTLRLVRTSEGLKIADESSPWENIAEQPALPQNAVPGPPLVRALIARGDRLERANDYDGAMRLYESARMVARPLEDPGLLATVLMNIGYLQTTLRQTPTARATLEESVVLARQARSDALTARALSNLGVFFYRQSAFQSAVEHYSKGLELARAASSPRAIATLSVNLSAVQMELGDYRRALTHVEEAHAIAKSLHDQNLQAVALHNLGDLHNELGAYDRAIEYYELAFAKKEHELRDRVAAANTLHSMAQSRIHLGQLDAAMDLLNKCLERTSGGKDPLMEAYALHSRGAIHIERGNYAAAAKDLETAIQLARQQEEEALVATTQVLSAEVHRRRAEPDRARQYLQQAEAIARRLHARLFLYDALASRARLEFENGARPAAQSFALDAIKQVESLRQDALDQDTRQTFFEGKLAPYHILMRLALEGGRTSEALEYAERGKARVLLDTIASGRTRVTSDMTDAERLEESRLLGTLREANAALMDAEGSGVAAAELRKLEESRRIARSRLAMFRSALYARHPEVAVKRGDTRWLGPREACAGASGGGVVLVEYVVTDSDAFAFTVTCREPAATVAVRKLPATAAQITTAGEGFRAQLAKRDLGYVAQAESLYEMLITPIAAEVAGADALVIVPDAGLWDVPFQALSRDGRFLIDRVAIGYAPSLAVLGESAKIPAAAAGSDTTLFAMANPTGAPASGASGGAPRRFPPLPAAEQEVRELEGLYGVARSRVHIGGEALESRVKKEARGYAVLHFATHGLLDNRSPAHSLIVLAPDREGPGEDGLLEAWELLDLDLDADVAVLSACETARGRVGTGEGMLGLSWSLFVAGVRTTVATQWQVESAPTSALMVHFHRAMLADPTWRGSLLAKARALQRATQKARGSDELQHPVYWAGVVVVGTRL